ncbi:MULTISPECIES: integrase core domain-containing protein [Klebsiella]|nr:MULTISPECIES: integrase core domain-containing protein [Klebsiella]MDU2494576.1 integrase core domain-containing protein [Klebsiella grimontii]HBR2503507.1 transposase [Klebsiella pneumoniae]HDK6134166.1 transposase [Klebsiella variicola]
MCAASENRQIKFELIQIMFLEDARCKIEAWRIHYNQRRPHSAVG